MRRTDANSGDMLKPDLAHVAGWREAPANVRTFSVTLVGSVSGNNSEMARRRGQRNGYLRIEHGSWLLTYRVYDQFGRPKRETVRIGLAEGNGSFTEKQ